MKELYKSPVISVEELEKFDVLCASGETTYVKKDNVEKANDDLANLDITSLLS